MLAVGVLIILLTGFLVIKSYDRDNNLDVIESLGLIFPIGLFIQVQVLTILDYLSLPITQGTTLALNTIIIAALLFFLNKREIPLSFNFDWGQFKKRLSSINLVWIALFLLVIYLEYLNFVKCIYFPTFDRDSLAAFDTLGYIFADEGTISGSSIFEESYNINIKKGGSYIAYPPFTQVAYAYVYLFGAMTSKLVPALLFASFLLSIYGVLEREIKATGAILITLLILITPEMLAFSSMSGTNVIHAIYASLGVIYGIKWILNGKNIRDINFWSSAILLSSNFIVRTEGVVFIGAVGLFFLIQSIKRKEYLNLLLWGGITILPALCWKIHQSVTGMTTESFIITELFYDKEKLTSIIRAFKWLFVQQIYYGWTFFALIISIIISMIFIRKDKKMPISWAIFLISVIGYALTIYHVDYVWDSMDNVLNFSAKRFFFCFVVIAWYITATNYPIKRGLIAIDDYLNFKIFRS